MSVELRVARCGRVPYEIALAWQEALVARRLDGGPAGATGRALGRRFR